MEISVLALYTIQYLIRMPSYSLPENEFLYDEVIHNCKCTLAQMAPPLLVRARQRVSLYVQELQGASIITNIKKCKTNVCNVA